MGVLGGNPPSVNRGLIPLFTGEQALSSLEDKTLRGLPLRNEEIKNTLSTIC